jgi:hypothetical protein
MKHYVGVFQPLEAGGWRALFPDVPACHVEEPSLDLAILRSAKVLAQINESKSAPLPVPRDLTDMKADDGWASASNVNWHACVVTMIPVRA